MAWTAPKTWADGEVLTYTDMNMYMRDNQLALFDRPETQYTINEVSDYTTNSASFVDIDATNLALTQTFEGGHVLAGVRVSVSNSTIDTFIHFDIEIDGTLFGGDDGLAVVKISPASKTEIAAFTVLIDEATITAGSHTFKLQWKTSGGLATLYAGAGTANHDVHGQFWIHEF